MLDVLTPDPSAEGGRHLAGTSVEKVDGTLNSLVRHTDPLTQTDLQCTGKLDCKQGLQNLLHMKSVGEQAKAFRLARGWNTRQMADAVGTSRQNIENLESAGARRPQYIAELARAMGTTVDTLLAGSYQLSNSTAGEPSPTYGSTMQPILAWEHQDDLPAGEFVMIPRLNIHLSAGGGREQVEIEFVEQQPQAFRAEWIRKKRLRPSKLASMVASGDSMEDRIHDGDAVVVDTSQTDVVDGKVYALWYEGGERIKRLYRLPGGGLRIHSDNTARHPEIVLGANDVEHVRIIGRVVHISGEGGL